jgi:hypothetical protein
MLRELLFVLMALFFLAALWWTKGKPKEWSIRRPGTRLSRDTVRAACVVALAADVLILATLLAGWRA